MYLAKIFGKAEAEKEQEQLARLASVETPEPPRPRRVRILGPARVEPQEPPSTPPPIRRTILFDVRPPSNAELMVEDILAAVGQDENPDVRHSTDGSLVKAPHLLTDEAVEKLEASRRLVPHLLFRTYSEKGTKRTRGLSSTKLFQPAQVVHNRRKCHSTMYAIPRNELIYEGGSHLLWKDRPRDEFLSWTCSFLFAIEHALGRARKPQPQWEIFICVVDPRKAKVANTESAVDGDAAPFYPALQLWEHLDLRNWSQWSQWDHGGLLEHKFSHETLSHGSFTYDDTKWRHVPLKKFYHAGFFKMYPQFLISGEDITDLWNVDVINAKISSVKRARKEAAAKKRAAERKKAGEGVELSVSDASMDEDESEEPGTATTPDNINVSTGLYTRLLALRRQLFSISTPTSIPADHIQIAADCARLFMDAPNAQARRMAPPPLHIFLLILGLTRRPSRDAGFIEYIRKYYKVADIMEFVHNDMHRVPDHLDEMKSYVNLLRDTAFTLGLPDDTIPPVVEVGNYRDMDNTHMKPDKTHLQQKSAKRDEEKEKVRKWRENYDPVESAERKRQRKVEKERKAAEKAAKKSAAETRSNGAVVDEEDEAEESDTLDDDQAKACAVESDNVEDESSDSDADMIDAGDTSEEKGAVMEEAELLEE